MKRVEFILALIIFSSYFHAQNYAQKWYFGYNCGLDFSTNPPAVIPSPVLQCIEGSASVSDAAGNLLFYTDGTTVWNKFHAVMSNGTGLAGDISSTQSSLIIKQPGSSTIFYLFTTAAGTLQGKGLYYSIVDISLASGQGSVTVKNVLLHQPTCEKLAGVRHCNRQDIWVFSHDFNSNTFRTYLVTSSGLNTLPILSSIGPTISGAGYTYAGQMKVSAGGKKLAMTSYVNFSIDLFDCDPSTGIISNHLKLSDRNSYGCEFSSDGTKFYTGLDSVYQWNLCAGNNTAILSSSVMVSKGILFYSAYQLAPNGKIYISTLGKHDLSVINNPNLAGSACGYSTGAQTIGTGTLYYGLPNFVASDLTAGIASFSLTQACSVISVTAPPVIGCPILSTFTATSWLFGDPASGAQNTSTLQATTHTYSAPGTYTVKLLLHTACGTDTLSQTINMLTPTLSVTNHFSLCAGNYAILNASGADFYSWNTGQTTSSIIISPTVATSYSVAGTYTNGCLNNSVSVINVGIKLKPTLSISGQQSVCPGETVTLSVSGANSYFWNTGATGNTIVLSPAASTAYTVLGIGANGCLTTQTILVTIHPAPSLTISGNYSVCTGQSATLSVSGASTYSWSHGTQSGTIIITPVTSTLLSVTGQDLNGCKAISTVALNVTDPPKLGISGSTSVCPGALASLSVTGASSYTWSTGANTNTVILASEPNTSYTVTGTDSNGCTSSSIVQLFIMPAPDLSVKSVTTCPGVETILNASVSPPTGITYLWQPGGAATSSITIFPNTTSNYTVTASLDGCPVSKSIKVTTAFSATPVTAFSYPTPLCINYIDPHPNPSDNFSTGGIFSSASGLVINPSSGIIDLSSSQSGNYTITYSLSSKGCTAPGSSTSQLIIENIPDLNLSPDIQILPGSNVTLTANGAVSYLWDSIPKITCQYCPTIVVSPDQTSQYCITAKNFRCSTKACVTVIVSCESGDLSLPNAFSPNNDGNNDVFCLQGWNFCIRNFSILIFDRWGEKVYESGDPSFCWDGSFNGKLLDAEAFTYIITALLSNGSPVRKKGNITLLR